MAAVGEEVATNTEEDARRTPLQHFFASHQLRTKASTPQLMKPLPPLPAEAYQIKDENARVFISESSRSGVPRLRLRAKQSKPAKVDNGSIQLSSLEEGPRVPSKAETLHSRPKLRLKLSRAYLGLGSASKSATVVRSPGLKQCNALAEFQHCTRNDLFSPKLSVSDVFNPPTTGPQNPTAQGTDGHGEENRSLISPQPSDQFDIAYPPTIVMEQETPSRQERLIQQQKSYVLESGGKENRRLRQKISMLRLRIAGSHFAKQHNSIDTTPLCDIKSLSTPSLQLQDAGRHATIPNEDCSQEQPRYDRGGKVKRWANNARHAVRLYVKRRLDRSSHNASH
jgi:hypothetical protein